MRKIVLFLTNANILELAADPWVLFLAFVLAVVAVLLRWRFVLLLLCGVGGILTVLRYSHLRGGGNPLDQDLLVFALGTFLIAALLIYFLFIRGD
jgi:hypothetical protein